MLELRFLKKEQKGENAQMKKQREERKEEWIWEMGKLRNAVEETFWEGLGTLEGRVMERFMGIVDKGIVRELKSREKAMRKAARKIYKRRMFEERLSSILKGKVRHWRANQVIRGIIEWSLPELYRRRAEKKEVFEKRKKALLSIGVLRLMAGKAERERRRRKEAERLFEEAKEEMERQLSKLYEKQKEYRGREARRKERECKDCGDIRKEEAQMTPTEWVLSAGYMVKKLKERKVRSGEKEKIRACVEGDHKADKEGKGCTKREEVYGACGVSGEKEEYRNGKGKRDGKDMMREKVKLVWIVKMEKRKKDKLRRTSVKQRWWKYPSPGPPG